MTSRRVVVVDDHAMFRTGVKAELAGHPGRVEVVGEAADVDEAVEVVTRLRPRWCCSTCTCPAAEGAR